MKDIAQQNPQAIRVFPGHLGGLRRDGRLTQAELGEKAGLTHAAISRYESGDRLPAFEPVWKMAEALGLKGPARGVFFMAAGHAPIGSTVMVGEEVIFDLDEDDEEAPIIHGLLSAA